MIMSVSGTMLIINVFYKRQKIFMRCSQTCGNTYDEYDTPYSRLMVMFKFLMCIEVITYI